MILMGVSGTMSVFRNEAVRAEFPAARAEPPPPGSYGPALEAFEAASGEAVQIVRFAPAEMGVHRLFLPKGASAYVDSQGKVVTRWRGAGRIEDAVVGLHKELLIGKPGKQIISVVALGGLLLIISGLVAWAWPRPRFGARLIPASGQRRDILSAHRNVGSLLGMLLLFQLLTAVGMAFGDITRPLLGVDQPAPPVVATAEGPAAWTRILAAAQAEHPDAAIRRVFAPRKPGEPYAVHMRQPGEWDPDGDTIVFVDGRGAVAGRLDGRDFDLGTMIHSSLKWAHSGEYGGVVGRMIASATGVGLILLGKNN